MKNTPCDYDFGLDLPQDVQIRRMLRVMEQELTEKQRRYLSAFYFDGQSPSQIARRYGVHRSTVTQTLQRAKRKLRRHLIY